MEGTDSLQLPDVSNLSRHSAIRKLMELLARMNWAMGRDRGYYGGASRFGRRTRFRSEQERREHKEEYNKSYYLAHKAEFRARQRDSRAKSRDANNAKRREWYKNRANKAKIAGYKRIYRLRLKSKKAVAA